MIYENYDITLNNYFKSSNGKFYILEDWLSENVGVYDYAIYKVDESEYHVWFRYDHDAIAFKLTYLEYCK